ncbi:unnamed protein product [Allacma fusca]|uniref:Protein CIP2A n=1 Tax=Allacma fusca TaxID=39272 RepID=A0A8J2JY62_9HEXA|nr:unnamed protein product [Allacma fusca]
MTELKIIKDFMVKVNGHGDDPSVRSLLSQMAQYIIVQLDRNQFAQSKEVTKIIFNFFSQIGEFEDVRNLLRDDFSLLKYLSVFLKMTLSGADRVVLVGVIEILTRGLEISWKAPYLVDIINGILSSILKHPEEDMTMALQILINLCSKNHSCVLILRSCQDYKPVWKIMKAKIAGGDLGYLLVMISHLNYLTETYIPAKSFQSGYQTAKSAFAAALENHDTGDYFVKVTLAIREMIETTCIKMKVILEDDSIKSENPALQEPENFASEKQELLNLVTGFQEDLHKFVNENRDRLLDDIKESILLCVITFLRPYTVSSSEPSLQRNCLAAAETARRILTSSSKPRLQLQTYKTILRVSELIFQNKGVSNKSSSEFISLFKDVVRSLKIDGDASLVGLTLELYTISLRLFSLLMIDPQVKDSVKQKLPGSVVLALFNKTTGGNLDQRLKFRLSVFAVDMLNVINHIFRTEELGHYLSNPVIVNHISNCIRNGNEKEISRALLVVVSTGQSSMQVVSRSLRQSQELIVGVPSSPIDSVQPMLDPAERMEVEMTSNYIDNHNDPDSSKASDLLAWSQIRREVHQQEVTMLNNHIMQLNRTNANLNSLLEKQSNFIAKHVALNEQRDLEISKLQDRYEDEANRAEERAGVFEKEAANLRQEGLILADVNESMRLEIVNLKQNIEELNSNTRDLEDKNAELSGELNTATDEIKSLQKKIQQLKQQLESALSKNSKLEDDVKLKENELDQLHGTLKQKQIQIDAIQSILGSQFAGKFDVS